MILTPFAPVALAQVAALHQVLVTLRVQVYLIRIYSNAHRERIISERRFIMKYVYIVDKHGKPLMPTTRFGHVRKLMKSGKAVPISNNPFTIRLKYDTTSYTQNLWGRY